MPFSDNNNRKSEDISDQIKKRNDSAVDEKSEEIKSETRSHSESDSELLFKRKFTM
jgi:hypothetical protein